MAGREHIPDMRVDFGDGLEGRLLLSSVEVLDLGKE